jgi:hypothetical protein
MANVDVDVARAEGGNDRVVWRLVFLTTSLIGYVY